MVRFAFKQQTITYKKHLNQYTNQKTLNYILYWFKYFLQAVGLNNVFLFRALFF